MIDPISAIKALGAHGSTAAVPILAGVMMFVPADEFARHVAENERGLILDLVDRAASEEDGPYKSSVCRSLTEAIARLCAAARDDALCLDRDALREKAGC